jgi:hypothetical protein
MSSMCTDADPAVSAQNPSRFTVVSDQTVQVDMEFDTGIR